ncbi:NAD(P)-dependent oxidoreductase [Streptomyces sp. CNQ085]|uniref:NAD-dependent epimerase/dehydratase family protein n=1 Tax=Streptomyces sp. CNQ085 TaxID=2886944 RepID=UPI001F509C37|nr:NAD-dependent epimerase/dehydratase family protein [Streptomyces sp. CNQ085]MCI0385804.1 NAD-dependent epimerase/dehydratase family protein [Streptomyces sp. CNQ085]
MITGATGFVGGHVVREAVRRGVFSLKLMTHRRPLPASVPAGSVVRADLADLRSLHGVCDGVDVLLHCASQIGGTPQANESVNTRGTAALAEEARRAGVARIVYLSTASVYGRGTFRNASPGDLVRDPGSPTSRTRARAEDAVLAAGGVVLRPHLVYGEGDTWVVPGIARILRALPGVVVNRTALMSIVSVQELARLLLGTGLAPASALTASVYHATHPAPVVADVLLRTVAECASLPWPAQEFDVLRARALLEAQGQSPNGLDMLTSDHWFDSTSLWSDLGYDPGPDFETDFSECAAWYARTLRATQA